MRDSFDDTRARRCRVRKGRFTRVQRQAVQPGGELPFRTEADEKLYSALAVGGSGGGEGGEAGGVAGVRIGAAVDEQLQERGAGAAADGDVEGALPFLAADVVRIEAVVQEPARALLAAHR